MTTYPPPSPPYLGPPAHSSGNSNKPIHRVVIHSTVSATEKGGARNIAAYFRSPSAGGSAHYVVDPGEAVQAAYDSVVCWHAPPNPNSLGIEMCDMPDASSSARWNDTPHQQMLDRTARLTAQLCLAYDVPITFLSVSDLKAGMHGITTHNNVSQAWHESSHWDPGAWPQDHFMELVRDHADTIRHGGDHDTLGDDMPSWKNVAYGTDYTVPADGAWHVLTIGGTPDAKEYSYLAGPSRVTGTLNVSVTGLAKGVEAALRPVFVETKKGADTKVVQEFPAVQATSNGGTTQMALPFTQDIIAGENGWARRLRFQIRAGGGQKITIASARVRGLYWDR